MTKHNITTLDNVITDSELSGLFKSVTELSDAHPYKINVSFYYRFKVWKTQILPGRLLSIKQENSIEYVYRMIELLIADGSRLTNRAIKEFASSDKLSIIIKEIDTIIENEITIYIVEIDKIKLNGVCQCKQ